MYQTASEGRPPLDLCVDPMSQLYRLDESSTLDRLKRKFATAVASLVPTHIPINWSHLRDQVVHTLAPQTLRHEAIYDPCGIGNKVLVSNNGGEIRGVPSGKTTTEIAMSIASPKIDGIREDTFATYTRSRGSRA